MRDTAPFYVDAHCHLDLYPDLESIMASCDQDGIQTITVTTTPRAWPRNHSLAGRFRCIEPALGFHPQLVREIASELPIWDTYLSEARVIGEVGLDAGPRFHKTLDAQKVVFSHILMACARARNKVITVHSVRAVKAVLDMIEQYLPGSGCRVILHWFTGTLSEATRAVDLGCYLSINMDMINNPVHKQMIASLPLGRILTETDGPFTKVGNIPAAPSDVRHTVERLAAARGDDGSDLLTNIADNYKRLFEA